MLPTVSSGPPLPINAVQGSLGYTVVRCLGSKGIMLCQRLRKKLHFIENSDSMPPTGQIGYKKINHLGVKFGKIGRKTIFDCGGPGWRIISVN